MPGIEEKESETSEKASELKNSEKSEEEVPMSMSNSLEILRNTQTFTVPAVSSSPGTSPGNWIGSEKGEVYGKLEGPDGSPYLVTKRKVVVGRESSHNQADIVIRENSFVSRGHLVLVLGDDRIWRLTCHGKNGVFVADKLVKKGAEPVEILQQSVFFVFDCGTNGLFPYKWGL